MTEHAAVEFVKISRVRNHQWKPRVGKHLGTGCQRLLAVAGTLHGAKNRLEIPAHAPAVVDSNRRRAAMALEAGATHRYSGSSSPAAFRRITRSKDVNRCWVTSRR